MCEHLAILNIILIIVNLGISMSGCSQREFYELIVICYVIWSMAHISQNLLRSADLCKSL